MRWGNLLFCCVLLSGSALADDDGERAAVLGLLLIFLIR